MPFIFPISRSNVFLNKRTIGPDIKSFFNNLSSSSQIFSSVQAPNTYFQRLTEQQPTATDVITLRNQNSNKALSRLSLASIFNDPTISDAFGKVQSFQNGSSLNTSISESFYAFSSTRPENIPPKSAFTAIVNAFEAGRGTAVDTLRPDIKAFTFLVDHRTAVIRDKTEVLNDNDRTDITNEFSDFKDKIQDNIDKLEKKPPTQERLDKIAAYKEIRNEIHNLIEKLENPNPVASLHLPNVSLPNDNFAIPDSVFDPIEETISALKVRANTQQDEIEDLNVLIENVFNKIEAFPGNKPNLLEKVENDLEDLSAKVNIAEVRIESAEKSLASFQMDLTAQVEAFETAKLQDTESFLLNAPGSLLDLVKLADEGMTSETKGVVLAFLDILKSETAIEMENLDPALPHLEVLENIEKGINMAMEKFSKEGVLPDTVVQTQGFPLLASSTTTAFLPKQLTIEEKLNPLNNFLDFSAKTNSQIEEHLHPPIIGGVNASKVNITDILEIQESAFPLLTPSSVLSFSDSLNNPFSSIVGSSFEVNRFILNYGTTSILNL